MSRLPSISLTAIPLLLERFSWMPKSNKPHLVVLYRALKLSEDERLRLELKIAELEGKEGERNWKARVKK
ncbi:hypothetical protein [Zavarzinella formosa]|uniref:hypothetical protein n=1 Tax=Zavarzinella formosa TaxID=360055 RepID=UPI00031FD19B|nr:hypothetical protein [Zavarzinella formosa]